MINIKKLRNSLKDIFELSDKRINIKKKKKMILEQTPNGRIKAKRVNYIKIEIIE